MNQSKTIRLFFGLVVGLIAVSSLLGSPILASDAGSNTAPASNAFCPFCAAINATFSEQISKHEVSVIAKLVEAPEKLAEDATEFPKAKFEIVQVLKGEQFVAVGMSFQTQLVGTYPVGHNFLVMGVEPPNIFWSTPMEASGRIVKYLTDSRGLPPHGADRLAFFQDYFEDEESVLAFDAYDEFALADYSDVVALKDRIKRDKLIKWINDPELRVDRRRLYFTMLGVCGTEEDVQMMEKLLVSDKPTDRNGLDALAAAYITLKGEAGIPLLEEHFLKNADPEETADTTAVITALRFHGTELNEIPKLRIAQAVRLVLDHPQLADTVIPDLARWEDWSVVDQLVDMFKNCKDEFQYIRVPVVAYLHSCPKPEAKKYLKELEAIDPDAIRRAKFYMGVDDLEESEGTKPESDSEPVDAKSDEGPKTDSSKGKPESNTEPTKEPTKPSKEPTEDGGSDTLDFPVVHVSTTGSRPETVLADDETDMPEPDAPAATEKSFNGPELAGMSPKGSVLIPTSNGRTETSNIGATEFVTKPAPVSSFEKSAPIAMMSARDISWLIIFVPVACSVIIFVLIWSVVNGWFDRLIF